MLLIASVLFNASGNKNKCLAKCIKGNMIWNNNAHSNYKRYPSLHLTDKLTLRNVFFLKKDKEKCTKPLRSSYVFSSTFLESHFAIQSDQRVLFQRSQMTLVSKEFLQHHRKT